MSTYNLTALLKLREHKKQTAETYFREASRALLLEEKKRAHIETCLQNTISARTKMLDNFFLKAQMAPCNKREILCHISSREKNLGDETTLRKSLAAQDEVVKCATLKLEMLKNSMLEAHRNLRVIEKHYSFWQQHQKRSDEIKEEYDNDDQNGVRFMLKKA